MAEVLGYTALSLNLISISLKNVLYLRVCSLIANVIYIGYGILLSAPPVYLGGTIAALLHSYWIYRTINRKE